MNAQISRLAVFALALIGALILATTYWQAWAAPGLANRKENSIQLVAQFTIERGKIYAADGKTVLATNRKRTVNGKTLYFRRYPTRGLAAHVVGYSTQVRSRAGLELSMNTYLTGSNANLATVVDTNVDKLLGRHVVGNDLILTLNARAQRVAMQALGRNCGAVVAIEPSTGRVLVMANSPTYDPNLIESNYRSILRTRADCAQAAPLLNRATAGRYVPGSTFKVVTAGAALESGKYTMETRKTDPGYCVEYGRRVNNYDTTSPFGSVTLFQAIQYSINSYFCEIGKDLGPEPIVQEMRDFGFYSLPPLETPEGERRASGLYKRGRLFEPKDSSQVDPGRLAFGQSELQVTPEQMAMVAAAVANRGVVMKPFVVERVVGPNGGTVRQTKRHALGRTMSAGNAFALTGAMEAAVRAGTGTAAQIPGIRVAGKTGTAETGRQGLNQTAFIAFAPVEAPRVAIAVMLENQSGTGGTTAAPIAKQVMQALLQGP
ncbi:MAG TPA: penicillin-binding transpeptidase domain-containing protein [Gaiellaceae bacterium]|nr:penicillin-binding transpeptidase domain-containing protein [Gaiellaceae bacterium]